MQRTQAKRGRPTKAEQEKKKAHEAKQRKYEQQADATYNWAQANCRSLMLVCDVLRMCHESQQAVAVEELHRITAELCEALT